MRLVLIRGVPGSGKSTFAQKSFPGVFHLENDMFHIRDGEYRFDFRRQKDAVKWCMEAADRALGIGMDVVVSNTFVRRRFVLAYKSLADSHNADFSVYRMTGNWGSVHAVPESVMESMRSGFEDWDGEILV